MNQMKVLPKQPSPNAEKMVGVASELRAAMEQIDAAYLRVAQALDAAPLPAASSSTFAMDQRFREFNFWSSMVQGAYLQEAKTSALIAKAGEQVKP